MKTMGQISKRMNEVVSFFFERSEMLTPDLQEKLMEELDVLVTAKRYLQMYREEDLVRGMLERVAEEIRKIERTFELEFGVKDGERPPSGKKVDLFFAQQGFDQYGKEYQVLQFLLVDEA